MDSDSIATHCKGSREEGDVQSVLTTTHTSTTTNQLASATNCTDTEDHQQREPHLDNRSVGLHRHASKYPHGLAVCVQTTDDADLSVQKANNYSRASTLRSSGSTRNYDDRRPDIKCQVFEDDLQRKYRVGGFFSSPENLTELQVQRFKYPLTANYYLNSPEAASKAPKLMIEFAKRFCKWKYIRWPLILMASVLLFFGLITYSMWLHDISVARERYMQQRTFNHQEREEKIDSMEARESTSAIPITTRERFIPNESTMMRALGTRSRYNPKIQRPTTIEYADPDNIENWHKNLNDVISSPDRRQVEETTTLASDAAALVPVKFTAQHGNVFETPAENDEPLFSLSSNGLYSRNQASATASSVVKLAKVSATIPPVTPQTATPTAPMILAKVKSTSLDSRCYSTSLPMCQGVLDYDLTYNVSTLFGQYDIREFQELIYSNCSLRAVEFICAALEPECRPSHIGILAPCRRICKAIMEACSEIIANSDTLTATFDCNTYPDSYDSNRCEDPTKRKDYCYDNEFECNDRSCIPRQWQCDNIKDCAAGEDEENCLICEQADEFRCRSNEKCLPETARCDMKYDCFDGSDEESCNDYGDTLSSNDGVFQFDKDDINAFPRLFSYAKILLPNQTNGSVYTYSTDTATDQNAESVMGASRVAGVSREEVTNSVPADGLKGFVNFRDSKEIMLTSDSENNFKFSSVRKITAPGANTTPLHSAASIIVAVSTEPPPARSKALLSACPAHQLRCVSGKCITVEQLCDKKVDCPDGFDELMCVYKDRTTTIRNRGTTIPPNPLHAHNFNTTRSNKRALRTTIKRKIKL